MSQIKSVLGNERGFMLLNVVFLTVITSLAAMILMNAAPRARNHQSTLRLTAIYLANEQFAELESLAAREDISGSQPFLGNKDDLTSNNLGEDNPIEFKVTTTVSGGRAKVKVTWQVGDDEFKIEMERTIGIVQE
ncbi:MAG: hypothetical protein IJQ01_00805 [Selenomonadaceae bacterium]|nr:hypothetical protein [Selenomonadaceae bacterium]